MQGIGVVHCCRWPCRASITILCSDYPCWQASSVHRLIGMLHSQATSQPQPAADQAENAKVQAAMFGGPEIVQEFLRPLPDEIEEVGTQSKS